MLTSKSARLENYPELRAQIDEHLPGDPRSGCHVETLP